jgi:ADP-ribose pyrophosphatase YjhB (NUDIX family)
MPDFYYLESDGQVYLVKDGGRWRFPKNRRELPCRFEPVFLMHLEKGSVLYAHPVLDSHPYHWFHKDRVIGRDDVAPLVREAVNRSLPRGASKVVIVERGRVLMVKAARGLTKGYWNLPGGFISYTEHPTVSACREAEEELGIRVRLRGLLGVYSETFPRTGGYMISFAYLGKRLTKTIRPHPEEIESYAWMPLRSALRQTKNPFSKAALRDYLKVYS